MRNIGYVRVSSADQNPNRQLQQMKAIGVDIIYQEKASGATSDRSELQKMLTQIKQGDTIYVTDLTRITRSTRDLFTLVDEIKRKQANLRSLKDTWLDLSEDNPYSHFLMTVMAGVNQLELDVIRIRQQEGIYLAKQAGRYPGRVQKYHETHAGMKEAIQLYEEGRLTVQQICNLTRVSRASLYRKLRDGKEQVR